MDYAFEFEQVVSIISAPFTVNEQFCLGELLLCSIRQKKKENSNLLTEYMLLPLFLSFPRPSDFLFFLSFS